MSDHGKIDKLIDSLHDQMDTEFPGCCYILIVQEDDNPRTHYGSNMARPDAVSIMADMSEIIRESPPDDERGPLQ